MSHKEGMKHTVWLLILSACTTTSHALVPASLGQPSTLAVMEQTLSAPGPITLDTVVAADWNVPLSGLLNIERAGLSDRDEPIQIFVHVIKHPQKGTFLVDSGVASDLSAVPSYFQKLMKPIVTRETTGALTARLGRIDGVLLTHVHLDHVLGLPDLAKDTPVYAGAGDARERSFQNLLMHGVFNDLFSGLGAIEELTPQVHDLFGDGSLWAIPTPGHTKGSFAYLARTTSGPVLLTGDASHTRYGWEHGVEPGTFSEDQAASRVSLLMLKALVERHPELVVRFGHQP
jgi:N-acyl homoserine lactone hydrolase